MTRTRRLLTALLTCLFLGVSLLTATPADAAKAKVKINSVGDRIVGGSIPIVGYLSGTGTKRDKTIQLQRQVSGSWHSVAKKKRQHDGKFTFPSQRVNNAGIESYRVKVTRHGKKIAVSKPIKVNVLPSENGTEIRTITEPYCPQLLVYTRDQQRQFTWQWSGTVWRKVYSPWTTVSESSRAASFAECVGAPVQSVPANAALPDIRMKNLNKCGAGDLAATGGDCFLIDTSTGRKLLKFAALTFNVGAGPSEIIADRSSSSIGDWAGYQNFYDTAGNRLGAMYRPGVEFYFAGDGHNHWHVRDFDSYQLIDATDGTTVARGEKHGFCLQDNTTYTPMQGLPGVPPDPGVYLESTSCGKGLPSSLTVIHGLSRGWGDTYPTTLPDQAIDITDLPDGDYTVQVTADDRGAVVESSDTNNTVSMLVTINGNDVTTHPETATGGLD